MSKRDEKRKNYIRLREKRSSQRHTIDIEKLEKLEKANHRRKLKVSIKLRLKKLTRIVNLTFQYLGE